MKIKSRSEARQLLKFLIIVKKVKMFLRNDDISDMINFGILADDKILSDEIEKLRNYTISENIDMDMDMDIDDEIIFQCKRFYALANALNDIIYKHPVSHPLGNPFILRGIFRRQ